MKNPVKMACTAALQFLVSSARGITKDRSMTTFDSDVVAVHTLAIHWMVIFILGAFGVGNAAATLAGQNPGPNQRPCAEKSVWTTAMYNAVFMASVSLLFLEAARFFVRMITSESGV